VTLHGASNIAAVVIEPVSGSAGVLPPPVGYLEKIRATCDTHGILLVFDEVITGFGRVGGAPFATSHFDVTPDLMALAKGLTGAVVPAGAVVAQEKIYETVVGQHAGSGSIEFFHGYATCVIGGGRNGGDCNKIMCVCVLKVSFQVLSPSKPSLTFVHVRTYIFVALF